MSSTPETPPPGPDRTAPGTLPPGAGAEPPAQVDAEGKTFERPHPLTPLIRGWVVLVAILVAVGRELVPDGDGDSWLTDLAGSLQWVLLAVAGVFLVAAAAGFVTWRFTRFVIDDEELRIETGVLTRRSKKIPFQRLQSIDVTQPFAARIFGLAELKLEAGAGDSGASLKYLSRARATRLRDYLVQRATGERSSIAEEGPQASAWTDLSSADEVLVRLSPRQLVLGFLLSLDFLLPAVALVVGLVVTGVLGVILFALGGIIPLGIALLTTVSMYLISQFNYTLSRSGRGLRISRGLTSLTSQSVPVDRIQGLSIGQPATWKALGLYRVRMDVLGHTSSGEDGQQTDTKSSLLFPVATEEQVRTALAAIMPEVDLEAIELHPSPRGAAWLRPWNWWTLRHGWDERVVVTRRGWLYAITEVVPHAKTQSVRLTQGPLQRALGLATVNVDTTPGPVNLAIVHVEPGHARRTALSQLDRMRTARASAVPGSAAGPVLRQPAEAEEPAAPAPETPFPPGEPTR
ncbi:PH domain-containing protein [Desertihabitans aurantiacus]|uniref:PH domain-containing protein n=1 Tax=Desertihabitans aurantiacus TaxID=2282477 RepID=UPI000DF82840|nr:PH domain-containing protein [Desertihabitans aurantiacus]